MSDLISTIYSNYNNAIKITIFNFFKTSHPFYDTIISTIFISLFTYLINYLYSFGFRAILYNLSFDSLIDNFKNFFIKKNTIIIEGKRSSVTSKYTCSYTVSSLYSDRFKAIIDYIINNIENNNTVYCIKEAHSNFQSSESNNYDHKSKYNKLDIFMVFQNKHFTPLKI